MIATESYRVIHSGERGAFVKLYPSQSLCQVSLNTVTLSVPTIPWQQVCPRPTFCVALDCTDPLAVAAAFAFATSAVVAASAATSAAAAAYAASVSSAAAALSELITANAEATHKIMWKRRPPAEHTPEMVEAASGNVAKTRQDVGRQSAFEGTGATNAQAAHTAGSVATDRAIARCYGDLPLHLRWQNRAGEAPQCTDLRMSMRSANDIVVAALWSATSRRVIIRYGRR